jgi:acyl-CoA synthetase (AMP-forming)/AMP-acid ligase II
MVAPATLEALRSCSGIDEMVRSSAARNPEGIAVIEGERQVSHGELDRLVDELAARLVELGSGRGHHCAFFMDHATECLVAFFAIQRAGYVMVPLNGKLTAREVEHQIAAADVKILVVSPSKLAQLQWSAAPDGVEHIVVLCSPTHPSVPSWFGREKVHVWTLTGNPAVQVQDARATDDPAALWFTSGTTGSPKAVLHSKRSGVAAVTAWVEAGELDEGDRGPSLNLFHIGTMSGAVPLIAAGGTVVLVADFKLENVLQLVHRHRLTYMSMQPIILNLLDRDPSLLERYDVSCVRRIAIGSAPIEPALLRRSIPRFPNALWTEGWAQTEINSGGTITPSSLLDHFGSIGLPIGCVEALAILDDSGHEVPRGTVGELCVQGPMVMIGYYRDQSATAETIREGWLHTGDLGYQDADGYVFLKGRRREVIIRGGENVYPAEVEAVLCEHPAIAEAAVVGIPDSVMTEVPVAFVALREGEVQTPEKIRAFVSERLARYKLPVVIDIVDTLPRNTSGKVQKVLLAEQAAVHIR